MDYGSFPLSFVGIHLFLSACMYVTRKLLLIRTLFLSYCLLYMTDCCFLFYDYLNPIHAAMDFFMNLCFFFYTIYIYI